MRQDNIDQIIDDIISDLPLQENVLIANMDPVDISILQSVFDLYIKSKVDPDTDDNEIMVKLWERLQATQKIVEMNALPAKFRGCD